MSIIKNLFASYSTKEINRMRKTIDKIDSLEPSMEALTDSDLKAKTDEFKKRIKEGETLDSILPEAFAVCREASKRVLGLRHFKVQLIGGIVLHQGKIAEMKTGEGKTLVATLPVYLNALAGNGVHVVTVNDYLAKSQSELMGRIYNFLGLSVGCILHGLTNDQRKEAYNADITYGTNNEFGFDYLRDNMVVYKNQMVQRDVLNYAIVDEIDSILIDEARTPLIISGPAEKSTELYTVADEIAKKLKPKYIKESEDKEIQEFEGYDYVVDEKAKSVSLTPEGTKKVEEYFKIENLSDPENLTISHHINQAIKAHGLFKLDRDYVVKDGEVIIVDEFTGRLMYGRRYNEGLHQAIEAKEHVTVARESKTYATITFQNYFRMYKKLAGMTGTAMTESEEFRSIYNLDVIEIPTNKEVVRKDLKDIIYKNEKGKFNAVIEDIKASYEKGQPVLVGTVSVEKSEILSKLLKKQGIKHEVLNAKYHDKEADIIAQAGKYKAITIATNMAGRGTDIMLGGNPEYLAKQQMRKEGYEDLMIANAVSFNETEDPEILEARKVYKKYYEKYKKITDEEHDKVIEAGGLKIIGTERHESRRIDNQLRGRAGRQGDPGESRFYISLEDDLMRLFGSDRMMGVVEKLGLEEDMPIENGMLTKTIESAQKRVESRNFNIRKHVLQYDDVMNQQREIIYAERKRVLDGEDIKEHILNMIKTLVSENVSFYLPETVSRNEWNIAGFEEKVRDIFALDIKQMLNKEDKTSGEIKESLEKAVTALYDIKEKEVTPDVMRELERMVLLRVVDTKWMDHIDAMDQLKQSVGLRAYGQKDPVVEYKFEGYDMFEEMVSSIQEDTVKTLLRIKVKNGATPTQRKSAFDPNSLKNVGGDESVSKQATSDKKAGRNDPCPCGSGKKYKQCCGK